MYAGTLTLLRKPADEALESTFNNGRLPALEVSGTQQTFANRPIQHGTAADYITSEQKVPEVATMANSDERRIVMEQREGSQPVATDWVADVTGTGLIAIESIAGEGMLDFPLGLFYNQTGQQPLRQYVNVNQLFRTWDRDDVLGDVWMTSAEFGDGATIAYHDDADGTEPTNGLGFKRPWNGSAVRGVVYESGYLALYDCGAPADFAHFVEDELLEYMTDGDEEDGVQATLVDSGGDPDVE